MLVVEGCTTVLLGLGEVLGQEVAEGLGDEVGEAEGVNWEALVLGEEEEEGQSEAETAGVRVRLPREERVGVELTHVVEDTELEVVRV